MKKTAIAASVIAALTVAGAIALDDGKKDKPPATMPNGKKCVVLGSYYVPPCVAEGKGCPDKELGPCILPDGGRQ